MYAFLTIAKFVVQRRVEVLGGVGPRPFPNIKFKDKNHKVNIVEKFVFLTKWNL